MSPSPPKTALKRRRTRVLLEGAGLAIAIVSIWLLPAWNWHPASVEIDGTQALSTRAVLAQLALPAGPIRLYQLDPHQLAARLRQLPQVDSVTIHRWLFPARLTVMIHERVPIARVVGTTDLYLDRQGHLFTWLPSAKPPLTAQVPPGGLGPRARKAFTTLMAAWPADATGGLDLSQPDDWRCQVGDLAVRLGTQHQLAWKMQLFAELKPLAQTRMNRLQYIDLRFPKAPSLKLRDSRAMILQMDASPDATNSVTP